MTAVQEAPAPQQAGESSLPAGTVFWAWIHGEDVRAGFMSSVVAMLTSPTTAPLVGSFFDLPSGPFLSLARNTCAEAFLRSEQEWLWFVDSDTVFGPQTLPRLLALADPAECPVLSAAVPVVKGPVPSTGWLPDLAWSAFSDTPDGQELVMIHGSVPLSERHRVDAVGTGCTLIHRSVLEKVGDGPFNYEQNGKYGLGEDLAFCRRATALGFPIHVAGHVRVGHAKVVTL